MGSDDLAAFIEELRADYEAGRFRDHPPIHVLPWLWFDPAERAIGCTLAEIEWYASMTPDEKRLWAGPRRHLTLKLRALQKRLRGEWLTDAEIDEVRRKSPG